MTTDISPQQLLEERGIRPTANRILVARELLKASAPMALIQLEAALDTVERSTIFRVLNLFRSAHLVHAIDDGSGSTKYEICRADRSSAAPHYHAHFHCSKCGATECLYDVAVPELQLPEGYVPLTVNHVVTGLCPRCSRL